MLLAGLLQIGLGFARAGFAGDYIPKSVIKGMLAAIGLVIILKRIPHALGYEGDNFADESFGQATEGNTLTDLLTAFAQPSAGAVLISVVAFAIMLWERPAMKRQSWPACCPHRSFASSWARCSTRPSARSRPHWN